MDQWEGNSSLLEGNESKEVIKIGGILNGAYFYNFLLAFGILESFCLSIAWWVCTLPAWNDFEGVGFLSKLVVGEDI